MDLRELYNKIYTEDDQERRIEIFESNERVISGTDISNSTDSYGKIARITADYAYNLMMRDENSKKALPYINKAIHLWENKQVAIFDEVSDAEWYKGLRYNRGRANFIRKSMKVAYADFAWLADNYPENKTYKKWKTISRKSLLYHIEISSAITAIVAFGLSMLLPKGNLLVIIIIFGIITGICFMLLSLYRKFSRLIE